jgi:hypothetical protein
MSLCDIIPIGVAIAISIKFFAELVRIGNATGAGWSTLQSVGEVTSKISALFTSLGDAVASFSDNKIPKVQLDDNE